MSLYMYYTNEGGLLNEAWDPWLIDANSASLTFTMEEISCDGQTFRIRRIDNNPSTTVTIQSGTDNAPINGSSSVSLNGHQSTRFGSLNGVWYSVEGDWLQ